MARRTYTNFDLLFEHAGEGRFTARVVASPVDDNPAVTFALPFDSTTLENLLLKLDPGRSGTRRSFTSSQAEAGRQLGTALYEAVFTDDLAVAWSRSKDAAGAAGKGLRLRLRLGDVPELAGLPWELLHDKRSHAFLAQSEKTPVVRYLAVPQPLRPLPVAGALRILVVISSPTDMDELNVDAEWQHVQEALGPTIASGRIQVDRLPKPTMRELGTWLRHHEVNVLHFLGHGDYDAKLETGVLYFCDDYGRSSAVDASVLGPYIHDHDALRLIVLNACRSSSGDAKDSFGGMAQGLVQQQASAVVAMQFPISDKAAAIFTGDFYASVADGFPVDQAVTYARKSLLSGFGAEWATPTVFLQPGEGEVFDPVDGAVVEPVVEEPVVEEPTPEGTATSDAPEVEVVSAEVEPAPPVETADVPVDEEMGAAAPVKGAAAEVEEGEAAAPVEEADPSSADGPSRGIPATGPTTRDRMSARAEYLHRLAQGHATASAGTGGHDPMSTGPTSTGPHPTGPMSVDSLPPDAIEPEGPRPLGAEQAEDQDEGVFVFRTQPVEQRPRRRMLPYVLVGVAAPLAIFVGLKLAAGDGTDLEQPTSPIGAASASESAGGQATSTDGTAAESEATHDASSSESSEPSPTTDIWPTTPALPGSWASAQAMSVPLTVDGLSDEWGSATPFLSAQQVFERDGLGADAADVTATWRLGWDASAYYLYVEVTDSTLTQRNATRPSQLWNGDSVHFEFGPYADPVRTDMLDPQLRHVMLAPTEDGQFVLGMNVADGPTFIAGPGLPGAQVAGSLRTDGYVVEAAIPWSALGVDSVRSGMQFVTNLNVSTAVPGGDSAGKLAQMWSSNPYRLFNNLSTRPEWGVVELQG